MSVYPPFNTTHWNRRPNGVITSAETDPTQTWTKTEPSNMIVVEGWRSLHIMVLGDTSNDDCDCEVFVVERFASVNNFYYLPISYARCDTILIGTGTSAGTGAGTSSPADPILSTEFMADTYTTIVARGYGDANLAAFNSTSVSGDGEAQLPGTWIIGDLGNAYGVVINIAEITTGNYFDALFKLSR